MNKTVVFITRTAILLALAVLFQSLRLFIPIPAEVDQFVVGSLVNLCLIVAAVKASAMAYLTATLESATPELRRLYGEYMAQSITGHESLIQLSVNKGWYKPYDAPENQLQASFSQSQQVINEAKQ
jgi:hypothetical protein